MFELIEKYGITIFGFTPTAMRGLAKLKEDFSGHNLSSLRILGSTGEPLDQETWMWYFRAFGQERCPIMNIIGGTELIGCHLSPLPVMPQNPGTVGVPGLGMDVALYDEQGNQVERGDGYLVCRKPFPSMTRGFLGEKERYLETYFSKWPNVWVHGDRAEIAEDGLWYMLGRSDDLIVVGGVKFDPAKIESALISFDGIPRVREAAAIGVRDPLKGQRIICFVTVEGQISDDPNELDEFADALQRVVQEKYDRMARPEEIYVVEVLPKNLAAKIPRKLIRRAYEGEELGDVSKVDNLAALDIIKQIGEEKRNKKREG
jgi:acetyl-CoA synthetase